MMHEQLKGSKSIEKVQQFIPLKHKRWRRKYINFIIEFWLLSDRSLKNVKLVVYTGREAEPTKVDISSRTTIKVLFLFVNKNYSEPIVQHF